MVQQIPLMLQTALRWGSQHSEWEAATILEAAYHPQLQVNSKVSLGDVRHQQCLLQLATASQIQPEVCCANRTWKKYMTHKACYIRRYYEYTVCKIGIQVSNTKLSSISINIVPSGSQYDEGLQLHLNSLFLLFSFINIWGC